MKFTCTIVVAGRMSRKKSPWMTATLSIEATSDTYTRVMIVSSSRPPRSSMTALRISRARRVWSTMPVLSGLPSSSRPAVPATRIPLPWRTAREYPNWNSYFVFVLYMYRIGFLGSCSGMDRRQLLDHSVRELLRAHRGGVVAIRLQVVRDVLAHGHH